MIGKLRVQRFKRFADRSFDFSPQGVSLLAGGNNSGKSSILQALAVWEFCRVSVEAQEGRGALEGIFNGNGVSIGNEEFSPVAIPNLRYLWTNLNTTRGRTPGAANSTYTMRIGCQWNVMQDGDIPASRELEFGLSLRHDRIFVKPLVSNVQAEERIPKCAYLPPFAGITSREERMSRGAQRRMIGRGLAGAALRNILFDLYSHFRHSYEEQLAGRRKLIGQELREFYKSNPWCQLIETLNRVFKCDLIVPEFDDAQHVALTVNIVAGLYDAGRFKPHRKYVQRDIMVEGSGLLQWLSVYALAVSEDIDVLLLDEPDAHLHPTLQIHLLDRLRSLARENGKQVLLATHSTELLRHVEPGDIFEVSKDRARYLTEDRQRIGLFSGLGSEYAPNVDQAKRHKRILFFEGTSDDSIIRSIAEKLGKPLPSNLVIWQTSFDHKQRKVLYELLSNDIPGLIAMSLRDRDEEALTTVGANLQHNDYRDDGGFLPRTLRRKNIENYLIVPSAIARASARPEEEVREFLSTEWGLGFGGNIAASNCPPVVMDAPGKKVILEGIRGRNGEGDKQSVRRRFQCERHDVVNALEPNEIAEDLKTLIDDIHRMCSTIP